MAKYIERETAIAKLTALEVTEPSATMIDAKRLLAEMPAADVEPEQEPAVWVRYSTYMMTCSRCGRHTARHRFEYCPHCGAKMDGKDEDDGQKD